ARGKSRVTRQRRARETRRERSRQAPERNLERARHRREKATKWKLVVALVSSPFCKSKTLRAKRGIGYTKRKKEKENNFISNCKTKCEEKLNIRNRFLSRNDCGLVL